MECQFCNYKKEIEYRLLKETEHFYLVPALGAFVEGYLLIVSKEHYVNISALPTKLINELEELERIGTKFLRKKYNLPVFAYEHGPCVETNKRSGNCIEHCHLGLVATDKNIYDNLRTDLGNGQVMKNYKSLQPFFHNLYSYLLFKREGEITCWENPNILSQYIRRLLTDKKDKKYNWRLYPYKDNMSKLIRKWRAWSK